MKSAVEQIPIGEGATVVAETVTPQELDIRTIRSAIDIVRSTVEGNTRQAGGGTEVSRTTTGLVGDLPVHVLLEDTTHPNEPDNCWITLEPAQGEGALTSPADNSIIELPFLPLHGQKPDTVRKLNQKPIDHGGSTAAKEKPQYRPDEQVRRAKVLMRGGTPWGIVVSTANRGERMHNIAAITDMRESDPNGLLPKEAEVEINAVLHMVAEWGKTQVNLRAVQESAVRQRAMDRERDEAAEAVDAARRVVQRSIGN